MNRTGRPQGEFWTNLPNVDWPPNMAKPTVEDIAAAALDVTGARGHDDAWLAPALCRVAMLPWLARHTDLNATEIFQHIGYSRGLRSEDTWHRVLQTPAGRAIAQAMGCRLREIVRTRMEQSQ